MGEDEKRDGSLRRGSEHVQIKGTTEELGQIVPAPVEIEDEHIEIRPDDDDQRQ